MKIALDGSSEVGSRAGRILLAERSLTYLGLLQPSASRGEHRTGPVGDLSTYAAIVTDGASPITDLVARAAVFGVPLVVWRDEPGLPRGRSVSPVIVGANLGSALAPSLAHHPSVGLREGDAVTIAWTEPGAPLRRGTPIVFPDPVGVSWAKERSRGRYVAHRDDEWAGAVATIDGPDGERIVGVGDLAAHLEAVTLAAATLVAARGGYENETQDAASAPGDLISQAMELELDVAVWRSERDGAM